MKTMVFVWTLKSVVAAVFFGGLILFALFIYVKDFISACYEEWKSRRDKEEKQ